MKNLLIVAYLFPPTSTIGGGVVRALKFTKYLPQYGWRPVVLTVRDSFLRRDESTLSDIPPEATIVRTFQLDPRYITHRSHIGPNANGAARAAAWRRRVTSCSVPDPQVGWLPFAVAEGLRTISRERIDAMFTTGPPFTDHVIGLALKRLTGVPWVADFRDPWVAEGRRAAATIRARLNGWLERRVLRACDAWTTVTDSYSTVIADGEPHIAQKGRVIANGFDPEDFECSNKPAPTSSLRLAYAGTLYPERASLALFEAAQSLRQQGVPVQLLVGQMAPALRCVPIVQQLLAAGVVEEHGSLPYRDALRRLATFDAFIVTVDRTHPGMVPGKLYEYLTIGRPILLLGPKDGASARLLQTFGHRLVADLDDADAIHGGICQLAQLARGGGPTVDRVRLGKFDRRHLTGELAALLDSIGENRRPAPETTAAAAASHRAD